MRRLAALGLVSSLLAAAPALAADPVVKPATSGITVRTSFDCHIDPAGPVAAGALFQTTKVKVTLKTGTLPKGKKIAAKLGIQPTGNVLTTFCSDSFGRTKTVEGSVNIQPPIVDPSYIWLCNAALTSDPCDAAPAVPK